MLSPWPAVAVTGLVFGLLHPVSLAYTVLAALAGAYFGALVVLTGNLLVPVVAHAGYDLVALLVLARMKPPDTAVVVQQTPSSATTSLPRASGGPMTTTATHAPGTFSWADLGTPDPAAAKRFYTRLFGWSFEDRPISDGESYTIFDVGGKSVAALYAQMADQRAAGIPPQWMSYVAVESADRSAARASELGGTVLAPAFDVMEAGRMAVIQDPTGGVLGVWEARKFPGAGLLGDPGALCWNELCTRDPARASKFYGDLFGWQFQNFEGSPTEYHMARFSEDTGGAIQEGGPSLRVYYDVDDINAGAARVRELGGSADDPQPVPSMGWFSTCTDTEGNAFGLWQTDPSASM